MAVDRLQTPSAHAEELHRSSLVIDGLYPIKPMAELLPSIRAGGVSAIHVTVGIHESFRQACERIQTWLDFLDRNSADVAHGRSAADVEAARAAGKIAVIFGFQNSVAVEDDPRLLRVFKELGVRIAQVTYNERNLMGDGCTERQNSGLSDLGLEFVAEMNRLNLLIDLSHAGEMTARDVIEASTAPVAITHANARALCDVPRNFSDDVIVAAARTGGVIGVCAFPGFVSSKPGAEQTVDDVIDHIDHISNLVGVEHVGVGTDLVDGKTEADYRTPDGQLGKGRHVYKASAYPEWPWIYAIRSVAEWPRLTEGLVARGYSDDAIRGILGENLLRLYRHVWGR